MGTLIVTEFTTLDGVAQAPGGPDEDTDSGFEHGGWQAPYFSDDDTTGDDMIDAAAQMDALLLGRRTYEIFAGYWPNGPRTAPSPSCSTACPSTSPAARSRNRSTGRARACSPATSPPQSAR